VKKIVFFLFAICFAISNLHAQTNKWSVAASFGIASPVGKFGNTDLFDSTSAFAKTGFAINVEAVYRFNRSIGVSLLFTGQQNSVDTKVMGKKFEKAIPGAYFAISSGDWNIGKVMAGINLSLPLDDEEKFSVYLRLMAGALKTTLPKITVTEAYYSDSLGNIAYSQFSHREEPLAWTFAYAVGVGCKLNLSKTYFVQGSIDYSGSSPKVPNYPVGARAVNPGIYGISGSPFPTYLPNSNYPKDYKQPIQSLTFTLGVGINF